MLFIAILTTAASSVHADEGVSPLVQHQSVAARNVCAWPNLTTLGDGTIVATIFNQPAHGTLPGDVDCWASTDGGETWERRATVAQRPEPNSNRMNVAAGLAGNGDLVVVASGYRRVGEDATFEE
ncbi:MAG TPA: sialidase family protein, partial [Armatimonadota bacterium]|nr:sialidase family protein [Armatimonadota bacterium]